MTVQDILTINEKRNADINAKFNPITGEGSVGERYELVIDDFPFRKQYLPVAMRDIPLVAQLTEARSIDNFITQNFPDEDRERCRKLVIEQFIRCRIKHDFPFWAAMFVYIQSKQPGEGEVLFRLTRPQRRFVKTLEDFRTNNLPIRLVMLKARQWGGSTTSQLYMAWLQLVHKRGLSSVIVSQTKKTSFTIKAMLDRALDKYPLEMLYKMGESYNPKQPKMENVGLSGDYKRIPQRDCTITIASYEAPDALRGEAIALAHLSEVGLWSPTEKKTPERVVRSACAGIVYEPYTMIIYESTANGTGNFFHREYVAAKNGFSQFKPFFVPWDEIEMYSRKFDDDKQREEFAKWLLDNKDNENIDSDREEPGVYLFRLFERGTTLEALNWYVNERRKYTSHADIASEFPSDDIEAFTFSGRKVFDDHDIEQLRRSCRPPLFKADIVAAEDMGEQALDHLRLVKRENGLLWVWQDVEKDDTTTVNDRYLVVVDVCKGHSQKADYAVIMVMDRIWMIDGENPVIVAQWRGHIDMDLLAWKAMQVAEYYDHALLVIESNTLETNNTKGEAEYILNLIRDVYDNLYAREQSAEDIKSRAPLKYGFHTNRVTKKAIIANLKAVIREQLYTERDERCLDEYAVYVETDKGGYEAPAGYHDDMLMTRAIGMHICLKMPIPTITTHERVIKHKPIVSEASF